MPREEAEVRELDEVAGELVSCSASSICHKLRNGTRTLLKSSRCLCVLLSSITVAAAAGASNAANAAADSTLCPSNNQGWQWRQ